MDGRAPEILIAASFTAAPLEEPLTFWFKELHLPHKAGFIGYQQLFQTLLDPLSAFAQNRRGANVALFRFEDLTNGSGDKEWEAHAYELGEALVAAAERFSVPLIVCICPESAQFLETEERRGRTAVVRERISKLFENRHNLWEICSDRLIAAYEVTEVDDPLADRAGHVAYRNEFYIALATGLVRTIAGLESKPLKAIAVDCDNTLWTGVCGEDGPAGVNVDAGRRAFQNFLLEQKRSGVLLTLLSKNNEADVRETFVVHPEMPLQWSDLTAHRINWEAKSENLAALGQELGLGLDSIIFLEDDARECAEVRRNCPEVITLQVPASSFELARFARHVWPLDQVKARTEEDAKRARFYVEHGERKSFERQAADLNEFLAGLRLEIVFAPVTMETLSRVAQLTQRTNQMNTTLSRYTESELRDALNNGLHAFTTTVRDRFGDYGLVGAVFAREDGEQLRVTDLLLSCRALGRGVEHKMLAHAGDLAERIGLKNVAIHAIRGPRNQPAIEFLRSAVGLDMPEEAGSASAACSAAKLKELAQTSQSRSETAIPTAPGNSAPKVSTSARNIEYQRIATELNTAAKIDQAIRDWRKPTRSPARPVTNPPQTANESKLAAIWCDLLRLSAVGIDEDFFELGGHSLLAVQLLSRVHRDAGVELPDRVIYAERLTIANLARSMELVELGIEDRESYEAILSEIESLTDEEVDALLAQEEGEQSRL